MKFKENSKNGITLIELIVSMGIVLLLSASLFQITRTINKTFIHSRNKLDILQATRIVMTGLRNELRNAYDKPQIFPEGPEARLNIPVTPTETIQYFFDTKTMQLSRGKKGGINEPNGDLRPFMFDDGQILAFEYDSSYRDSKAFVESELSLNSKVWFKVSMKILYTAKFKTLKQEEKDKILANPDADPRVKSFFMMITPRRVNWLLQATQ